MVAGGPHTSLLADRHFPHVPSEKNDHLFVSLNKGKAFVLGHVGAQHGHGLIPAKTRRALRLLLVPQMNGSGGGGRRGATTLLIPSSLEKRTGEIQRQSSNRERPPGDPGPGRWLEGSACGDRKGGEDP
ncbi:hypothetical protein B296_00000830 [Ensete ventricosum]|uniref:Uncharacterized protein n=1 Tax=Ensete ventricosum TaxID=4639 RepID=A0A427B7R8_ENSVE|nr:hypothetical protein B296_00000830 [Ensete ventricosum]